LPESQLLAAVLDLAEIYNVTAHHCYESRTCTGRGFPDLVLVGRRRVLFAELKATGGQLSRDQTSWRYRLIAAGEHWVCWTPADLDNGTIGDTLAEL
jgi:hypothetical protein